MWSEVYLYPLEQKHDRGQVPLFLWVIALIVPFPGVSQLSYVDLQKKYPGFLNCIYYVVSR